MAKTRYQIQGDCIKNRGGGTAVNDKVLSMSRDKGYRVPWDWGGKKATKQPQNGVNVDEKKEKVHPGIWFQNGSRSRRRWGNKCLTEERNLCTSQTKRNPSGFAANDNWNGQIFQCRQCLNAHSFCIKYIYFFSLYRTSKGSTHMYKKGTPSFTFEIPSKSYVQK